MMTSRRPVGRFRRAVLAALLTVGGTAAAVTATATPAFACHGMVYSNPVRNSTGYTVEVTSSFPSATNMSVQASAGSASLSGTSWATGQPAITATVTGLTAGQSSSITINANLSNGGTACTPYSNSAATAPAETPTFGSATATADGFTFSITNFDGTRYDYTFAETNGASASVNGSGVVAVTGLTAGQSSTVTVTATAKNGSGYTGSANADKNGSALAPGAPAAPAAPTATAGEEAATVNWAQPAANGSTVSGYTVTSSPGALTCSVSTPTTSCIVAGLTNGTAYTFTVTAHSNLGDSPASNASNAVTPVADSTTNLAASQTTLPPGSQITLTAAGFQAGATVTFYLFSSPQTLGTAIANGQGTATLQVRLPSGVSGRHTARSVGIGANGLALSQDISLNITSTGFLPVTSSDVKPALIALGVVLLVAGFLLVRVSRRRRVRFTA